MSLLPPTVVRWPLPGLAVALLAGFWLAPSASAAPTPADATFSTNKAVLWLGHTQVIPLHLKTASEADIACAASVADPRLVEIVRPPVFLAGEQTAYLRVHPLRAGRTRMEIFGGPALEVEVKSDPAEAASASVDQESRRPEIISPMPGAVVWGEFGVGVTMFDDSPAAPANAGPATAEAAAPAFGALKVQLRLPDGRLLDPINTTPATNGPERQFQFSVTAGNLPAGPLQLVAVASSPGSGEPFTTAASSQESAPLCVQVKPPPPGRLWTGECESPEVMGATKSLYAPARPARFGIEQPVVGSDPHASGGQFVQYLNRGWCLPFIVPAEGEYQMVVRARAAFAGGAYPSIAVYVNNSEEPAALARLPGSNYDRLPIGTPFHLDAGPQILSVQFKNPFSQAKENRTLFLDNYELARVDEGTPARSPAPVAASGSVKPATQVPTGALVSSAPVLPASAFTAGSAPQLNVLYPANGAAVFGADAVVFKATGGTAHVETADLLIDGRLQNVPLHNSAGNAPMVFPMVLRGLEPGEHRLAVRATVTSGQTVDSPARLLVVLPQAPAVRGPYERAVWLLDRLAFGPEPAELAAVLTQGESKWLATRLIAPFNSSEEAVLERSCEQYKHVGSVAERALDEWIETDNPVRARFTAWAENHFSTWITKTKPAPKWDEHLAFCRLGIAPFSDLLEASAHSTAMLTYLDQEKSYAGKINENYAREIMELHTLGVHGGYKQTDVTELAEVLNGWTTAEEAELPQANPALRLVSDDHGGQEGLSYYERFVPALNDGKPRRVLGLEFPAADPTARYDRIQLALEMLAGHPSTAEHVCRKLAEHYVGVPAPDPLVHHLANAFLESGGDMRVVLFTMVGDPGFWSAPPKVATPFDYSLRTVRVTRGVSLEAAGAQHPSVKPEAVESFLKRSGMGLFDRVTPDGYPENSDAYADSNALLQRWRFMQTQVASLNQLVPLGWRNPPSAADVDDLNHMDPPAIDSPQRFIDLVAVRLTGRLLSPRSNQATLEVLGQGLPADLAQALVFVSLLPETSLR